MTIAIWVAGLFISWLTVTLPGIAGFGDSLIILPVFLFLELKRQFQR